MSKCDKCFSTSKQRRYLQVTTEKTDYTFCSKCAYDAYMILTELSAEAKLQKEEEDLLRRLRKFISN